MNTITRFITARRISLGLILVLAGCMYVSTLIPQEIDSTPAGLAAWRRGHEGLLWLVDTLHLHRLYAQPWFAVIIVLAAVSLGLSCVDQLDLSRKKLVSTGLGGADELAASVSEAVLRTVAVSRHYRPVKHVAGDKLKFVRNPWGHFGVLLLHVGMAVVIAASLYVALTYRQGVLTLVEGERHDRGQPWRLAEQGLLVSPLTLPGTLRLDRVTVRFDDKNQPVSVTSQLTITGDGGAVETLSTSINQISRYKGLRIYHAAQYGDAFTISITDPEGGTHTETIAAQQPVNITMAGYSDDISLSWLPYQLSAKYFADADRQSMLSRNPELVLRLTRGDREVARTSLVKGGEGSLGEYRVRLLAVNRWAKLIFVDTTGMPLVFAGFAIIMLGGLLHYLAPPRELIAIRQQDGLCMVYWKAAAFREFFMDERDEAAAALNYGEAES